MSDTEEEQKPPPIEEDTVPDLERASSSARAASTGPVFSEEDSSASVVANNSFVPAVVISEKEDPNVGDGGVPIVAAHQVDDEADPQPQAPTRQQNSYGPSATATPEETNHNNNNFASNNIAAPQDDEEEAVGSGGGLNPKIMAVQGGVHKKPNHTTARLDAADTPDPHEPPNPRRRKRKGMMLAICICLLVVIGIIVALVVTLSGDDEEDRSRDASLFTNSLTEAPSTPTLTTVPTVAPTVSTPVPTTPSPTSNPTDPPTANQNFCLQGSDGCGDVPDLFGLSLGSDWESLTCRANLQGNLKCTIVACNEVFSIPTPFRILHFVGPNSNQRIELDSDAFELFENNGGDLVYLGFPNIRSDKIVDIELPTSYFPNLEEIQVWLESAVVWPFDPVDRLPNQITLSFSPC